MPVYQYRCGECGNLYEPFLSPDSDHKRVLDDGWFVCHTAGCAGTYKRRFSLAIHASDGFGDGFWDPRAGQMVTSTAQMDSLNAKMSDEASERLGVEHRFVRREAGDLKPPEVD